MQALKQRESPNQAMAAADRLHSAAIHLLRWLRTRDRESGIGPAQLSALSVLVFAGPKSLLELALAEQVKAPTMSRIVKGLLKAKLAIAEEDERDRRALIISATKRGMRLMHEARQRRVETLARVLRTLAPDEVTELVKAAELIESLSRQL